MPDKLGHLRGANVSVAVEPGVKARSSSLRRDRKRRDRGDFMATALDQTQAGRLALGRPGSDHQGKHEETAFIQEDQVSAEGFGVFLYAANGSASSGQCPARSVPALASPVSGSSSPGSASTSRCWISSIVSQNGSLQPRLCASKSRGRYDSPGPKAPQEEFLPAVASLWAKAREADLESAWDGVPSGLASERLGSSEPRNSGSNPPPRPLPDRACPISAEQSPSASAFPAFPVFHLFSYFKYIMKLPEYPNYSRRSIKSFIRIATS